MPGRERGTVLILVMLFAVGILAIGALSVDLAQAFLTQEQMQAGTDTAALEGLRYRDAAEGAGIGRERALAMLGVVYDDDLDPDPFDPDPLRFGAGPVLELLGGLGETNALAQLSIPASPVYKPSAEGLPAQPNFANLPHGDLVDGAYDPLAPHAESPTYARLDFDPAAAEPDAFLARLRRTGDPLVLDQQPGVSSSGPTLPFLFGLGALIHGADASYPPRVQGVTVRSTSIAAARRALRATGAPAALGGLALAPVAIDLARWNAAVVNQPFEAELGTDVFFAVEGDPAFDGDALPGTVGEPIAAGAEVSFVSGEYLVPVVTDVAGARVVGFGIAELATDPLDPRAAMTVIRRPGRVLPVGVDARAPAALRALAADEELATAHRQLLQDPVLAAVLAR